MNKKTITALLTVLVGLIILIFTSHTASADEGTIPPRTVPPTTIPEPVRGDDCLATDSEFYPGLTRWTATPCNPRTGELLNPDWNANDIPIVPAPYPETQPEVAQSAPAPLVTPQTNELPVTGIKLNITIAAGICLILGVGCIVTKRII